MPIIVLFVTFFLILGYFDSTEDSQFGLSMSLVSVSELTMAHSRFQNLCILICFFKCLSLYSLLIVCESRLQWRSSRQRLCRWWKPKDCMNRKVVLSSSLRYICIHNLISIGQWLIPGWANVCLVWLLKRLRMSMGRWSITTELRGGRTPTGLRKWRSGSTPASHGSCASKMMPLTLLYVFFFFNLFLFHWDSYV